MNRPPLSQAGTGVALSGGVIVRILAVIRDTLYVLLLAAVGIVGVLSFAVAGLAFCSAPPGP